MRKALRSVVVAALVLTGFGVGPLVAEPRRVALIIAIEGYEALRPLQTPVQDALAMNDLLGDLGFEVTLEIDRDLRQLRTAVTDFTEDAAGADLALVYYAGHGVEITGENLILPVDVSATEAEALKAGALPLNELATALRAVVPAVVLVMDACREDPFGSVPAADAEAGQTTRGARPLDAVLPEGVAGGFARVGKAEGMIFAFSTAPGAVASDGTGQHSPFAAALIRHLPVPGRSLLDALTLVQQDVYDRSGGWQLPYVEAALPDLVFLAGEPPPPDERDRLLLAMAGLTEQDRALVETVASRNGVPLAPLYASWLAMEPDEPPEEQEAALERAAGDYVAFQNEVKGIPAGDPAVAALIESALADYELGALDAAREKLEQAKGLGLEALERSRDRLAADILALASTYILSAQIAETQGDIDAVWENLLAADQLFYTTSDGELSTEARTKWARVLLKLGSLSEYSGDFEQAERVYVEAINLYNSIPHDGIVGWQAQVGLIEALIGLNSLSNYLVFEPSFEYPEVEEVGSLLDAVSTTVSDQHQDIATVARLHHDYALLLGPAAGAAHLEMAIRFQDDAIDRSQGGDIGLSFDLAWWLVELGHFSVDDAVAQSARVRALAIAMGLASEPAVPGGEALLAQVVWALASSTKDTDTEEYLQWALEIMKTLEAEGRAPADMWRDIQHIEQELRLLADAP